MKTRYEIVIFSPNGEWQIWLTASGRADALEALAQERAEYPHHRFALRLTKTTEEWD